MESEKLGTAHIEVWQFTRLGFECSFDLVGAALQRRRFDAFFRGNHGFS